MLTGVLILCDAEGDHWGHAGDGPSVMTGACVLMNSNAAARALSNSLPIANRTCICSAMRKEKRSTWLRCNITIATRCFVVGPENSLRTLLELNEDTGEFLVIPVVLMMNWISLSREYAPRSRLDV